MPKFRKRKRGQAGPLSLTIVTSTKIKNLETQLIESQTARISTEQAIKKLSQQLTEIKKSDKEISSQVKGLYRLTDTLSQLKEQIRVVIPEVDLPSTKRVRIDEQLIKMDYVDYCDEIGDLQIKLAQQDAMQDSILKELDDLNDLLINIIKYESNLVKDIKELQEQLAMHEQAKTLRTRKRKEKLDTLTYDLPVDDYYSDTSDVEEYQQGLSSEIKEKPCVVLYRGVCYARNNWTKGKKEKIKNFSNIGKPVASSASLFYYARVNDKSSDELNDIYSLVDGTKTINQLGGMIRSRIKSLSKEQQHQYFKLYVNQCAKHRKIAQSVASNELTQLSPDEESLVPLFENILNERSEVISTTLSAREACRYAIGDISATKTIAGKHQRPHYDNKGKPHHQTMGRVTAMVMPTDVIRKEDPYYVMRAYANGDIDLRYTYVHGQEVIFVGSIDAQYLVFDQPIRMPDFSKRYKSLYNFRYGISEIEFLQYRKKFQSSDEYLIRLLEHELLNKIIRYNTELLENRIDITLRQSNIDRLYPSFDVENPFQAKPATFQDARVLINRATSNTQFNTTDIGLEETSRPYDSCVAVIKKIRKLLLDGKEKIALKRLKKFLSKHLIEQIDDVNLRKVIIEERKRLRKSIQLKLKLKSPSLPLSSDSNRVRKIKTQQSALGRILREKAPQEKEPNTLEGLWSSKYKDLYYFNMEWRKLGDEAYNNSKYLVAMNHYKRASAELNIRASSGRPKQKERILCALLYANCEIIDSAAIYIQSMIEKNLQQEVDSNIYPEVRSIINVSQLIHSRLILMQEQRILKDKLSLSMAKYLHALINRWVANIHLNLEKIAQDQLDEKIKLVIASKEELQKKFNSLKIKYKLNKSDEKDVIDNLEYKLLNLNDLLSDLYLEKSYQDTSIIETVDSLNRSIECSSQVISSKALSILDESPLKYFLHYLYLHEKIYHHKQAMAILQHILSTIEKNSLIELCQTDSEKIEILGYSLFAASKINNPTVINPRTIADQILALDSSAADNINLREIYQKAQNISAQDQPEQTMRLVI